jgi:hypothetical protein
VFIKELINKFSDNSVYNNSLINRSEEEPMVREYQDKEQAKKSKKRKREDTDFVPLTMPEPERTRQDRLARHDFLVQSQEAIVQPEFAEHLRRQQEKQRVRVERVVK